MAIAMIDDFGPGKGMCIVYDNCVVKTQEEVDRIIENCSRIIIEDYVMQQRKLLDKTQDISK